jgi:uncharacterized protein
VNHFNQIDLTEIENLVTANEGILAEQFVGQELLAQNQPWLDPQLYYWSREEKSSNAEIDFIFQHKNHIYPVEVKAGKTGTLKSMQLYLYEKKFTFELRAFNSIISPTILRHQSSNQRLVKKFYRLNGLLRLFYIHR